MSVKDIELPSPAWKLKEIVRSDGSNITNNWQEGNEPVTMVIFQYATFRTNEELWIYKSRTGGAAPYMAFLRGAQDKRVTERLTQERWAALYAKAIAARTLLGRMPTNMIEEIF